MSDALPYARNTTYVAATTHVNLSELAHWQDLIAMLWHGQHDSRNLRIAAYQGAWSNGDWDYDRSANSHVRCTDATQGELAMPVVLPAGSIITQVTLGWDPASAAAGLTATLYGRSLVDGSLTAYGNVASNSTSYHTRSFVPSLDVVSTLEAYFIEIVCTDQNSIVAGASLAYRKTGRITTP